jgi:integrase
LSKSSGLDSPEQVKAALSTLDWANSTKELACDILADYYRYRQIPFTKPRYERIEKLPFIPLENEIDLLIGGCGPKTSTVLQTLKETGARIGEIWGLKWSDIDNEKGLLNIAPEKGSRARQFKISSQLCSMIARLPHDGTLVFGKGNLEKFRRNYEKSRKGLARRLSNPRLNQVMLHTFRHWFATKTYWKTKDILFTQKLLGHRSLSSTLVYTHLVNWQSEDGFHSKAVKTTEEAKELVAQGWEYVATTPDQTMLFRRRS